MSTADLAGLVSRLEAVTTRLEAVGAGKGGGGEREGECEKGVEGGEERGREGECEKGVEGGEERERRGSGRRKGAASMKEG